MDKLGQSYDETVVVQSLSHVCLFATPLTIAHKASLSITISGSLLRLKSIESVVPSNHLISVFPFSSCLQSLPASGSFQMSQFFTASGPSTGVSASASVPSMNIQDWFPLGLTDLISLQSKVKVKSLSRVQLCDPMDCSLPAPLSMGFSRQEYWNGLPFPSPGDLPSPGIKPGSPTLQADSLPFEPQEKPLHKRLD